MKCVHEDCDAWSTVIETRTGEDGRLRRRRECGNKHRFTTQEAAETYVAPKPTMSMEAAAELLHLSPVILRKYVTAGKVPAGRVGRKWLFVEADLIEFIRGQYVEPKSCPSIDAKTALPGGSTSRTAGTAFVDRLTQRIDAKRKESTTSSR